MLIDNQTIDSSESTIAMKALVIADRDPHINISEAVRNNVIDIIITLGDLTREDILGLEQISSIPKIGIYGNHDSGTYMDELGIINLHLRTYEFRGITFGGFQGCVRYKDNPDAIMCTQQEAINLMHNFPKVDVFISHCPPRGINDEEEVAHQGFDALRLYLDKNKPTVWLHGHTYPSEDELIKRYGFTRIEYVYKFRIVDL